MPEGLVATARAGTPRLNEVALDPVVFGFAVLLTVVASLLF